MKALVIAEKPSVARDIARVLKCGKKINGAIEGERYIVTWGLGHLVTLADPEDYDKKYKEWKIDVLPMKPAPFKLEVIKQTGKQFAAVKTQIHRKDVNEIIIATDAGREGELVARLILEKAGSKKPIKRLWISSVTDKAIREGFAKLKNGHEYDALYDAAMCRAEADWLVGINATRALTCKYNAQLSCGRVQTPTLAMIAKREEKIRSFIPEGYYGMTAKGQNIMLTWQDQKSKSYRSFDKEKMTGLMKKLDEQKAVVEEIKKTPKKTYAPLLYDLTELQREANQRFGYSAKETLNIMQRLYENHKVLTYPRTDSRYLSKDIVPTIKDRLEACGTGPYRKLAMTAKKKDLSGKLAFVNDAKVSDHHAIIPTEQFVDLSHMTNEERKIYDLVVRRFLAVLYPPFEYEQTQVKVKVGGETFLASGKIVKAQGWRAAYEEEVYSAEDEEEEEVKKLPTWLMILYIIFGGAAIVGGSQLTVNSATAIAKYFGMSDRLIGLTIVALGTSLPELITSVTAACKHNADIAIGNIVGSNIFNILFVLGITALLTPVQYSKDFIVDNIMAVICMVMLFLCVILTKDKKLNRAGGILMLLSYAAYFVCFIVLQIKLV